MTGPESKVAFQCQVAQEARKMLVSLCRCKLESCLSSLLTPC